MKEALKLALDALEWFTSAEQGDEPPINKAITAIKEALAQPEQEPVAWEQFYPDIGKPQLRQEPSITKEARGTLILHSGWDDLPNGTKFYTTPPKPEPHNFCPRCGKRLIGMAFAAGGVHTCTPPEGGHQ